MDTLGFFPFSLFSLNIFEKKAIIYCRQTIRLFSVLLQRKRWLLSVHLSFDALVSFIFFFCSVLVTFICFFVSSIFLPFSFSSLSFVILTRMFTSEENLSFAYIRIKTRIKRKIARGETSTGCNQRRSQKLARRRREEEEANIEFRWFSLLFETIYCERDSLTKVMVFCFCISDTTFISDIEIVFLGNQMTFVMEINQFESCCLPWICYLKSCDRSIRW